MASTHLLIRWAEDPPKWDVLRRKQIAEVLGGMANFKVDVDDLSKIVGSAVLAIYDRKRSPARAMVLAAGERLEGESYLVLVWLVSNVLPCFT